MHTADYIAISLFYIVNKHEKCRQSFTQRENKSVLKKKDYCQRKKNQKHVLYNTKIYFITDLSHFYCFLRSEKDLFRLLYNAFSKIRKKLFYTRKKTDDGVELRGKSVRRKLVL